MSHGLIALSLLDDTSDYQLLLRSDAEAAAQRHGFDMAFVPAAGDAIVQIRQVYELIHRAPELRPRVLLLFPAKDASFERLLRDAAGAGVVSVILNRRPEYVLTLRREIPRAYFGTVSPDQTGIGRLQGEQVRALLPNGGFFLYVMGPSMMSASSDRLAGLRATLPAGTFDWAQVHGDWKEDVAEKAVRQWIGVMRHGGDGIKARLIVAQNDAMAVGAKRAFEAMATEIGAPDLARVPAIGVDGLPSVGVKLVERGQLAATVVVPPSSGQAVEWAVRALDGEAPQLDLDLPVSSYPEPRWIARLP